MECTNGTGECPEHSICDISRGEKGENSTVCMCVVAGWDNNGSLYWVYDSNGYDTPGGTCRYSMYQCIFF